MHIIEHAYVSLYAILPPVKPKNIDLPSPDALLEQLTTLLPAAKGSLALVNKPCIRPKCKACAQGKKHPNYLLSFTEKGQRRCLYVPKPMVPTLEKALENGRQIEDLLYAMGPALLKSYRAHNPAQTGPKMHSARRRTKK
jgi:hypothetical protein